MLTLHPGKQTLGARITGVDLNRPLSDEDFASVLRALGDYGVVCFPEQPIEAAALRSFSTRFG
ncbi:MAG: TauD/TfdA dioxygenase family protein, partial [Burkholderiales bacterium]